MPQVAGAGFDRRVAPAGPCTDTCGACLPQVRGVVMLILQMTPFSRATETLATSELLVGPGDCPCCAPIRAGPASSCAAMLVPKATSALRMAAP